MRFSGYFLLFIGFAAVNMALYPRGGVLEAICHHELSQLPQQGPLNRVDVLHAMERVAYSAWERGPSPLFATLIMVTGAILMEIGTRREIGGKQRVNAGSGPN